MYATRDDQTSRRLLRLGTAPAAPALLRLAEPFGHNATPSVASLPIPPIQGRSFGRFDEITDLVENASDLTLARHKLITTEQHTQLLANGYAAREAARADRDIDPNQSSSFSPRTVTHAGYSPKSIPSTPIAPSVSATLGWACPSSATFP
jgi:hypothetical protein